MTKQNDLNIINAINDRYINRIDKYLVQLKGDTKTRDVSVWRKGKNGGKYKDDELKIPKDIHRHLQHGNDYGLGQFATDDNKSKFMLFDLDFENNQQLCKHHAYNIIHTLIELGIPSNMIYAANSGGKGIHIILYFEQMQQVHILQQLYQLVLKESDLHEYEKQIEFRPTKKQGVKIHLGWYHKNLKKRVSYIDTSDLTTTLPIETILTVNTIDTDTLFAVLDIDVNEVDTMTDEELRQHATRNITPQQLPSYKFGNDKAYTHQQMSNYFKNGISHKGTRNNTMYLLILWFNGMGLSREQTLANMLDWQSRLDKSLYSTPYDKCIDEIVKRIDRAYSKNETLIIENKDIYVTDKEIRSIITARNINNQLYKYKHCTLLLAHLIHAKRYRDLNGEYYMTYKQMRETTGIKSDKTLRKLVQSFAEVGLIEIVKCNTRQKGNKKHDANRYRVTFACDNANKKTKINPTMIYDFKLLSKLTKKYIPKKHVNQLVSRDQFKYYCS